MRQAREGDRG